MALDAHLQLPQPHDALAAPEVAHAGEEEQLCDGPPLRGLRRNVQQGMTSQGLAMHAKDDQHMAGP